MEEQLPTRWEVELEFVQSLANMQYLTYLAQTGHLEDPKFLNYLEYLEYWRKPEYAKQLVYPNCLHILTLLKSHKFRKEITRSDMSSIVYNDMVERWREPPSSGGTKTSTAEEAEHTETTAEEQKLTGQAETNQNEVSQSPAINRGRSQSPGVKSSKPNGFAKKQSASPKAVSSTKASPVGDTSAMDVDES